MQETTAGPAHRANGSATIADIVAWPPSATASGRRPGSSATASGATSPTRELGETVSEIGRGLIDLGHPARRPRRAAVHDARSSGPTRTSRSRAPAASSCPIYPTNSPEECAWVAGNSESRVHRLRGRRAGGEDRRRPRPAAARSRRSSRSSRATRRRHLPRRAARARPRRATRAEVARAHRRRQARGPVHDHLHLGHDRPAEGLRAHPRQLPRRSSTHVRGDRRHRGGRGRLPLPPARALLRAADPAAGAWTSARRSPTGAATRSRSCPT